MGIILFDMLTRRVPFHGTTPIATIMTHVNSAPPDPRELAPEADPQLCRVYLKALQKAPADRYPSARTMLAAIRGEEVSVTAATIEMPAAMTAVAAPSKARWPRVLSRIAIAIAAAFLLTVGFFMFAKAMGWPVRGKWVQIKVVEEPAWAPPATSASTPRP